MLILPNGRRPLEMNIVQREDKVVLQFNQDVAEVVFELQDAIDLAHAFASITQDIVKRNHSH